MRIVLRSFIPTKEFSKANSLFLLSKIKFIYLFILAIYILLDCATRGKILLREFIKKTSFKASYKIRS